MISHYLKCSIRNIFKQKISSLINIFCLSVGLSSAFLILLYISHELSYDRHNYNYKKAYRINSISEFNGQSRKLCRSPYFLADELKNNFPEVTSVCRVLYKVNKSKPVIKVNQTFIHENNEVIFSDDGIFDIFDIQLTNGSKEQVFKDNSSCIISEEIARKYFKDENPLGKTFTYKTRSKRTFRVDGVFKKLPANSIFQADIIVNIEGFIFAGLKKFHRAFNFHTFVLFNTPVNEFKFNQKLAHQVLNKYHSPEDKIKYELQNIADIYLHSTDISLNNFPEGNPSMVLNFGLIAVLILVLGITNYIISSTVQGEGRANEIALRKVVGANRKSLIIQFLFESVILCLICLPISVLFVELFLPEFNRFLDKNMDVSYAQDWIYLLGILFITLLTAVLSGGYVSMYLSKINPAKTILHKRKQSLFRKVLISVQLIIFIGLLVCASVIFKQLRYLNQADLGYDENNLISLDILSGKYLTEHYQSFKNELLKIPNIQKVSAAYTGLHSVERHGMEIKLNQEQTEKHAIKTFFIETDYLNTLGVEIIEGRDFQTNSRTDSLSVILNESAVQALNLTEPLGKNIYILEKKYTIIGIVQDFVTSTLVHKVDPIVIIVRDKHYYNSQILIRTGNNSNTLIKEIDKVWDRYSQGDPLAYRFVGIINKNLYTDIKNLGKTIGFFAIVSVSIAILGLFGLTLYITKTKIKQIGIRKIYGATINDILRLVTIDFLWLTIISNLIAWPISWYFMDNWLRNHANRIELPSGLFLIIGLCTLLIVLFVNSINAIKVVNTNPVDTIRYE